MWVRLKFTNSAGRSFKLKKEMTVKEATKYFDEHLKNDKKIVKVWLTVFPMWHEYHYKTLKEIIK